MEKRVQGWSRAKRIALIEGRLDDLPGLSRRDGQRRRWLRCERASLESHRHHRARHDQVSRPSR